MEQCCGLLADQVNAACIVDVVDVVPADALCSIFLLQGHTIQTFNYTLLQSIVIWCTFLCISHVAIKWICQQHLLYRNNCTCLISSHQYETTEREKVLCLKVRKKIILGQKPSSTSTYIGSNKNVNYQPAIKKRQQILQYVNWAVLNLSIKATMLFVCMLSSCLPTL